MGFISLIFNFRFRFSKFYFWNNLFAQLFVGHQSSLIDSHWFPQIGNFAYFFSREPTATGRGGGSLNSGWTGLFLPLPRLWSPPFNPCFVLSPLPPPPSITSIFQTLFFPFFSISVFLLPPLLSSDLELVLSSSSSLSQLLPLSLIGHRVIHRRPLCRSIHSLPIPRTFLLNFWSDFSQIRHNKLLFILLTNYVSSRKCDQWSAGVLSNFILHFWHCWGGGGPHCPISFYFIFLNILPLSLLPLQPFARHFSGPSSSPAGTFPHRLANHLAKSVLGSPKEINTGCVLAAKVRMLAVVLSIGAGSMFLVGWLVPILNSIKFNNFNFFY